MFAENRFCFRIVPLDCSGDAEFASVRLSRCPPSFDFDQNIYCTVLAREDQRSLYGVPLLHGLEEFIQLSVVDADSAAPGANPYSGNGSFSPSCAETIVLSVSFDDVVAKFNHCIQTLQYFKRCGVPNVTVISLLVRGVAVAALDADAVRRFYRL